ncbi:hypothetical protein GCM10011416_02280 [Polaribacter pacificus]|uniref:FAD-binding domain-containing protein n=1 Tax=Polaribacter pacificus TaxID=1775173 RepID=A0A917HUA7_9FLAO|nr:FAD-dependent monooxygenase [Polaribacter pacificus]GGG89411.1 hypothetical protein GCM10011416_02280 [Polaribacter pacificus]
MRYAIIGAGIGGLTTALAFEKKGIDYHLFERAPELNEVGAGIWLAPNALQVLESLDILEEIQSNGNCIDRITIGKPDLSPISDSLQDNILKKFGYTTVAIHRANLQKVLFDKIPSEKITLGKSFKEYKELDSGKIAVFFEDGSRVETDYLIGADGIHSPVRKQLFPESTTRYSGQTCWRGVAELRLDKDYDHRGYELWGNQIRFGISRIAKDKVYWFAVAKEAQNSQDNTPKVKEKLQAMFVSFHPVIAQLIKATPIESILKNDIYDLKPMKKWHQNKVCLLGDAGHATTPNMGQGGAQAIEDAYYLSNLIEREVPEDVFALFQEKRQKKVHMIVQQSWNTGRMAHWKYGKKLRNFLVQQVPKSYIEKKMIELYQIDKF